jgi:putative peptide zinc metalloprotease protein
MESAYCQYPPEIDQEVEISLQPEGERAVYVVGRPSVGRYIKLGQTEYQVLQLIGGRSLAEISAIFGQQFGGNLAIATLVKFLSKLNQVNLLAGEGLSAESSNHQFSRHAYLRFRLFDPDPIFSLLVPKLRWVWTPAFVLVTTFLMITILLLALGNAAEVATHASRLISEHFLLIFLAGFIVVVSHEFAHGLTCKASFRRFIATSRGCMRSRNAIVASGSLRQVSIGNCSSERFRSSPGFVLSHTRCWRIPP